jgi:hypothetical protein
MAATATIRVPVPLRDRINRAARDRGLTVAGFLACLLDEPEREQMLTAFGKSVATADDQYRAEANRWAEFETDWPRE